MNVSTPNQTTSTARSMPIKSSSSCLGNAAQLTFLCSFVMAATLGGLGLNDIIRTFSERGLPHLTYAALSHTFGAALFYAQGYQYRLVMLGDVWIAVAAVLIPFALLSGSYMLYLQDYIKYQQASERQAVQRAAGLDLNAADQGVLQNPPPTYGATLRRCAWVCVLYIPIMGALSTLVSGFLLSAFDMPGGRDARQLGLLVVLTVWMAGTRLAWTIGARIMGRGQPRTKVTASTTTSRITPTFPVDVPLSVVPSRLAQLSHLDAVSREMDNPTVDPAQVKRLERRAAILAIGGGLLIMGVTFALLPLGEVVVQALPLPNLARGLAALGYIAVYGLGVVLVLPRIGKAFMSGLTAYILKQGAAIANIPNPAETVTQAMTSIKAQQTASATTVDVRAQNRVSCMVLTSAFVTMVAGAGISILMRDRGFTADESKTVFALVMLAGLLAIMFIGFPVLSRFAPKSSVEPIRKQWEAAMHSGDYETLLPLVDQAMANAPNWESKLLGAAAYSQAGRSADAERIAREVIDERMEANRHVSNDDTVSREANKRIARIFMSLMAGIALREDRLDEAEKLLNQAFALGATEYVVNNKAARLALLRNEPDSAQKYLDAALRDYRKQRQPPSAYHDSLRAWLTALQGDLSQARSQIEAALARTPAEHVTDLAELQTIYGYLTRSQRLSAEARDHFRRAARLDPKGAYGKVAQREADSL